MAKYSKDDCRNHGGQIVGKPMTMDYIVEKVGKNRHERRVLKHWQGVRKNTKGFPIGFNKLTWDSRCAELAYLERQQDASRGRSL